MIPAINKIAVFNHKGGVGKTTTSVNLAACLAHEHKKQVLAIDLDPQANMTRSLLGKELPEGVPTIATLLDAESNSTIQVDNVQLSTPISTLHILPSTIALSELELKLVNRPHREFLLKNILKIKSDYEFTIIDCPPSLGVLSLNALAAADGVIIPCETQYLGLRGIQYVLDLIALIHNKINPTLRILGVLPTKYYGLSLSNREVLNYLVQQKVVPVFSPIVRSVRAEEAPNHGLPLCLYVPDSPIALQYSAFAKEVLKCQD